MISIRQNCSKCNSKIDHKKVTKESGIYNCSTCNIIGSIYDEREYKEPTDLKKPKSISVEYFADKMYIDIKGLRSVPIRGPLAHLILGSLILLAIGGIERCLHFDASTNPIFSIPMMFSFAGAFTILITISYFRIKAMILRIELGPKMMRIHQINKGKVYHKAEFETESYMISQIFVNEQESYEKDSNGSIRNTYKIYFLKARLKDMSEKNILPEMRSKETYLYLERIIEDYLGIKDRKISSGL